MFGFLRIEIQIKFLIIQLINDKLKGFYHTFSAKKNSETSGASILKVSLNETERAIKAASPLSARSKFKEERGGIKFSLPATMPPLRGSDSRLDLFHLLLYLR